MKANAMQWHSVILAVLFCVAISVFSAPALAAPEYNSESHNCSTTLSHFRATRCNAGHVARVVSTTCQSGVGGGGSGGTRFICIQTTLPNICNSSHADFNGGTCVANGGTPQCPSGQVYNNGTCGAPPCPEAGTPAPKIYEITLAENEPYCKNVMINGCPHSLCGAGASPVPIDESGNNCYQSGNGSITCWVRPGSTGPATPCEGDCPPPPPEPPPVEQPKQIHEPETATQNQTDPETGTNTQTQVEVKREVQPDGVVKETETKTTTQTQNGQTTVTTETNITHRNPNGTTTTTNTTTRTNPDGSTETLISGSSSKPGGEGVNKQEEEESAPSGTASGNCETPPSCQGDANLCAILRQQWETMCYGSEYELEGDFYTPEEGVPKDRLGQAFTDFRQRISDGTIVDGIDNFFSVSVGGSCPSYSVNAWVFSIQLDQWCSSEIPWELIEGIIMAVALLIASRIAFN